VSYPLEMSDIVEDGLKSGDEVVLDMFVTKEFMPKEPGTPDPDKPLVSISNYEDQERQQSQVMSLHNGYGFIRFPDNNLFFLHDDLIDVEFTDLKVGDMVEFNTAVNNRGQRVAKRIKRAVE
jgi:cold shock CspA family protein